MRILHSLLVLCILVSHMPLIGMDTPLSIFRSKQRSDEIIFHPKDIWNDGMRVVKCAQDHLDGKDSHRYHWDIHPYGHNSSINKAESAHVACRTPGRTHHSIYNGIAVRRTTPNGTLYVAEYSQGKLIEAMCIPKDAKEAVYSQNSERSTGTLPPRIRDLKAAEEKEAAERQVLEAARLLEIEEAARQQLVRQEEQVAAAAARKNGDPDLPPPYPHREKIPESAEWQPESSPLALRPPPPPAVSSIAPVRRSARDKPIDQFIGNGKFGSLLTSIGIGIGVALSIAIIAIFAIKTFSVAQK